MDDVKNHVDSLAESAYLKQSSDEEWGTIENRLAEYAYSVLAVWVTNGTIFRKLRLERSINLSPIPIRTEPDAATELAGLTVAAALNNFRNLRGGPKEWNPLRGSSASTFFIGQCLLQFPNEYRRWLKENRLLGSSVAPTNEILEHQSRRESDPAKTVATRLIASELLSVVNTRSRFALAAHAMGYTYQEIAIHLNATPKAVEMLLYKARYRIRLIVNSRRSSASEEI
ncbi:hypothetical protein ACFP1Z_28925 [Streptomyces gamaensis]|uniref:RNA polymerase sigma factor 70 region 4 type 2 domain-containing protein n=1 Tax=Streptomyces gamaensis TaxID=1763542 RepID=A0ABW0Z9J4_9ACTN